LVLDSLYRRRLKVTSYGNPSGAKQATEKLDQAAKSSRRRNALSATYGTTEIVPFPKTCVNQSFSAACEVVPFPELAADYGNPETALAYCIMTFCFKS
jgi:hypothetical protein